MEFRPCIVKSARTGQSVHITIMDRELYLSGFWSFDDLIEMCGDDSGNLMELREDINDA